MFLFFSPLIRVEPLKENWFILNTVLRPGNRFTFNHIKKVQKLNKRHKYFISLFTEHLLCDHTMLGCGI